MGNPNLYKWSYGAPIYHWIQGQPWWSQLTLPHHMRFEGGTKHRTYQLLVVPKTPGKDRAQQRSSLTLYHFYCKTTGKKGAMFVVIFVIHLYAYICVNNEKIWTHIYKSTYLSIDIYIYTYYVRSNIKLQKPTFSKFPQQIPMGMSHQVRSPQKWVKRNDPCQLPVTQRGPPCHPGWPSPAGLWPFSRESL